MELAFGYLSMKAIMSVAALTLRFLRVLIHPAAVLTF